MKVVAQRRATGAGPGRGQSKRPPARRAPSPPSTPGGMHALPRESGSRPLRQSAERLPLTDEGGAASSKVAGQPRHTGAEQAQTPGEPLRSLQVLSLLLSPRCNEPVPLEATQEPARQQLAQPPQEESSKVDEAPLSLRSESGESNAGLIRRRRGRRLGLLRRLPLRCLPRRRRRSHLSLHKRLLLRRLPRRRQEFLEAGDRPARQLGEHVSEVLEERHLAQLTQHYKGLEDRQPLRRVIRAREEVNPPYSPSGARDGKNGA
jgi:hypothetical protein